MGAVGEMAMQREEGLATGFHHPNILPLKLRRELQCASFPIFQKNISQQEKLE